MQVVLERKVTFYLSLEGKYINCPEPWANISTALNPGLIFFLNKQYLPWEMYKEVLY